MAVFRATEPGEYLVEVDGDHGIMALGESLPGAPLYGFGPTMVVGFGFVVGSIVLAGVVASMRRRSSGRNGVGPQVIVVGGAVALVVGGAAVAVQGRADSTDRAANRGYGDDRADPEDLPDWMERCADPEYYQDNVDTGACGPTAEELHEMNMHYADRMGFEGDLAAANAIAEEVRNALRPIATGGPSADEVAQALAPWGPAIRTSTNAVGTSGTAFAVSVDGGCVFGSVHDGVVDVEVGGYINDGGCLAEYGH